MPWEVLPGHPGRRDQAAGLHLAQPSNRGPFLATISRPTESPGEMEGRHQARLGQPLLHGRQCRFPRALAVPGARRPISQAAHRLRPRSSTLAPSPTTRTLPDQSPAGERQREDTAGQVSFLSLHSSMQEVLAEAPITQGPLETAGAGDMGAAAAVVVQEPLADAVVTEARES